MLSSSPMERKPSGARRTPSSRLSTSRTAHALAAADRRLLEVVGSALAEAVERAGDHLACRPGCTECCHGPFPINRLDAWRLRQGLAQLTERDPERAQAVLDRAREQLSILAEGFPGDPATGALAEDSEEATEAFFTRHGALPCPSLDPATGRCDLYEHRPVTCRTFGPPVRLGESDLPPCRLCFVGCSQEEVEACRAEPDPHGLEDRLVARFDDDSETLIAFVLALP
jgi:Fe-S-cluster containining protein